MPFIDAVRLALAQIRVQKLKSFFTLLGVTIGVMFLIAVVSIVEGMGNYMEHDFAAKLFGINTFELRRRPDFKTGNVTDDMWREWQRRPRIRDTDIQPVVNALPPGTLWSASGQDNVQMVSPWSKPRTLSAEAVDGDYFKIRNLEVASGRLISPQELAIGSPVIVIGKEIADKFFPNLDPVGRAARRGNSFHRYRRCRCSGFRVRAVSRQIRNRAAAFADEATGESGGNHRRHQDQVCGPG